MGESDSAILVCGSCRKEYRIASFDPTKSYLCSECSATLTTQTRTDATVVAPLDESVPSEVAEARCDPAKRLGSFVLVDELGRGGVGVVYKAWDEKLARWVALKRILPHACEPEDLARFRREGKMAAKLDHPNIVAVHEIDEDRVSHFIVMKYIDGHTLDKAGLKDVRAAVEAVRDAARAIAYAHQNGIIHRDIKPQNVMLDREGRLYVLDFGLAKPVVGKGATMSGTTGYLGTPAYMAPEQARGLLKEIDTRTDVYSLGATLWSVLAGKYPHPGESVPDFLVRFATEPTPSVRDVRKDAPEALDAILLKAMDRDKARRYPTAQEFAAALDEFLGGRAPEPPPKRKRRVLPIGIVLLLLLGVAAAVWRLWPAPSPKPTPPQPAPRGDPPDDPSLLREVRTLSGHDGAVRCVAFSPDGRRLASGSEDKTIRVWDAATGAAVATLTGHADAVLSVAFHPDGKKLASSSGDHTIKLWDLDRSKELRTLTGHARSLLGVLCVAFSPDGKLLASGGYDGAVKLWDAESGAEIRTLSGHQKGVMTIAFDPTGARLASGSDDMTVKVWECASGKETLTLFGHSELIWSVAFRPQGDVLVSAGEDRQIKVWDLATGKEIRTLTGHSSAVKRVLYRPKGAHLYSCGDDTTIRIWDAVGGREVRALTAHAPTVWALSWSPDGATLASGGGDHRIKLWRIE